jgi:hypothetical protein
MWRLWRTSQAGRWWSVSLQEPEVPPKQTAERPIQAATRLMSEPKVYEFSQHIGVRRDVWHVTFLEPGLQTPPPQNVDLPR